MSSTPTSPLYGPLILKEGVSNRQMLDAIGEVALHYDPVPFLIDGWEKRDGMHGSVIAFPVKAPEPLRLLTRDLAGVLAPLTTSQNAYDAEPDKKWFHVTIANRLGSGQAEAIYSWLTGRPAIIPEQKAERKKKPGLLERFLTGPRAGERTGTGAGNTGLHPAPGPAR